MPLLDLCFRASSRARVARLFLFSPASSPVRCCVFCQPGPPALPCLALFPSFCLKSPFRPGKYGAVTGRVLGPLCCFNTCGSAVSGGRAVSNRTVEINPAACCLARSVGLISYSRRYYCQHPDGRDSTTQTPLLFPLYYFLSLLLFRFFCSTSSEYSTVFFSAFLFRRCLRVHPGIAATARSAQPPPTNNTQHQQGTGQQPQQTTPHNDDEAERPNGRLLRACKVAPTTVVTPSHRTNRVRPGQLTVPDIWPKARSSSLASSAAAAQATTQQQKAFRHYYHHVQYSVLFLSSAHPGHFLLISDIARPFSFSTSFDPTPPPTSSPTPPPPSASPTHTNRPSHPLRQATPPSTPAATGNQTAGSPWRHLSYKISHRIAIAIASRTCRHFIYLLLIPRCSARQSG